MRTQQSSSPRLLSRDEDVLVRASPCGLLREGTNYALIESAGSAKVDLSDAGARLAQLGILKAL